MRKMRATVICLATLSWAAAVLSPALAQNIYPVACADVDIETVYCEDVDAGQGSCHGSLVNVITYVNGDGNFDGEFNTLQCSGGTNRCSNGSPGCPTCPN